jgi:hypothetical protein
VETGQRPSLPLLLLLLLQRPSSPPLLLPWLLLLPSPPWHPLPLLATPPRSAAGRCCAGH